MTYVCVFYRETDEYTVTNNGELGEYNPPGRGGKVTKHEHP